MEGDNEYVSNKQSRLAYKGVWGLGVGLAGRCYEILYGSSDLDEFFEAAKSEENWHEIDLCVESASVVLWGKNSGRWTEPRNPVILSVIRHRQKYLDYMCIKVMLKVIDNNIS
jgi:hypothetical protein